MKELIERLSRLTEHANANGHNRIHLPSRDVEAALEALKQSQWISVEERLPEEDGFYFVMVSIETSAGEREVYPESSWWNFQLKWCGDFAEGITHWKPISPPESKP